MPQIGPLEILVVLVVALVVFGPNKLPELGRQVGRGYASSASSRRASGTTSRARSTTTMTTTSAPRHGADDDPPADRSSQARPLRAPRAAAG